MAYTYEFTDAENTSIKRTDDDGNVAFVPVAPGNRDYAEYLASGVTATAYVAPAYVEPDPTPLELLTTRVTAIESNEVSDDAVDSSLLSLIAGLTARVTALESN